MTIAAYERRYIGDGVYAYHDGYQIWIETPREDGMHRIALEPAVFDALVKFRDDCFKKENTDADR